MNASEPKNEGPLKGESATKGLGQTDELQQATTRVAGKNTDTNTLVGGNVEEDVEFTFRDPLVGGKIGKYEIRALLGEGGMGAVYLAFDPLIEREVALKILAQSVGSNSSALQRFLGEARAIGRLNSPHVVSIYDIDQWEGQYFIVMELLSGGSVAELSDKAGALPWELACRIVAEAARGLASAHAAGMIHRDIKPENLMRTSEGSIKVVDFGLSKLVDSVNDTRTAVTREGQILGTPQYMSPEQFETAEVDARTDIYSLGATLFRLLTGRFPYHDCQSIVQVMAAHMNQPPPIPTKFVTRAPAECDRIVARAMAKNRDERYQAVADMAVDLQRLIDRHGMQSQEASSANTDDLRDLDSVLIVEPSKLQGAIFKDAFLRAGAKSVILAGTSTDALSAAEKRPPDLLITAMELPDGRGLELLRDMARRNKLMRTTVVLHSSDSSIEELLSISPAACLVLGPKKSKPDDVQRVIHAGSSLAVQRIGANSEVDPATLRVRIVMDTNQLPAPLAELLRRSMLLDVDVVSKTDVGSREPDRADLTMLMCSGHINLGDVVRESFAIEVSGLSVVVHFDGSQLQLRSVVRNGVVAVPDVPLDAERMARLLQSCEVDAK